MINTKTGLLWYYGDLENHIYSPYRQMTGKDKLRNAIERVAPHYGKMFKRRPIPNLCYIHSSDAFYIPVSGWVGDVYVQSTEHIKLHCLWLGYEKNIGRPLAITKEDDKYASPNAINGSQVTTWKEIENGLFYADTYNKTRWFCLRIPETVTRKRRIAMEEDLRRIANWFSLNKMTQ